MSINAGPALNDKLDLLTSNLNKVDSNMRSVVEAQQEIRESTKNWMEQIQIGEYEAQPKARKLAAAYRRTNPNHRPVFPRMDHLLRPVQRSQDGRANPGALARPKLSSSSATRPNCCV
ncbi:MAG: hypothetical protein M5U34_29140 [Chloroflexi bacterium]|nr:hypothetical protein [Chloroflexota bacterium]